MVLHAVINQFHNLKQSVVHFGTSFSYGNLYHVSENSVFFLQCKSRWHGLCESIIQPKISAAEYVNDSRVLCICETMSEMQGGSLSCFMKLAYIYICLS